MESWAALAGQHWAEAALVHCRSLASFRSVGRRRSKTALIPTVSGGLAVWSARELQELQATRLCVAHLTGPAAVLCSASVPDARDRAAFWSPAGERCVARSLLPAPAPAPAEQREHPPRRGCRADWQTDGIRHRLDLDPRFSPSMIGRRARRWRQGCMHATRSNPSRAVHSACQRPLDLPPSSAPVQCVYPVIVPAAHRGKHFIHRPSLPPSPTPT